MNSSTPRYDPAYLADGTPRQREAFECLTELKLFLRLKHYTPAVIGTIPLGIDVKSSDLDIACYAPDLDSFGAEVERLYGHERDFQVRQKTFRARTALITTFRWHSLPVEIFTLNQPVVWQYGYRHWHIESRLLKLGGEVARQDLHQLRLDGWKTEPAFAHYFASALAVHVELGGLDAYESLYRLSFYNDTQMNWVRDR